MTSHTRTVMCSYRYWKVRNKEHKGRHKQALKYTNINKQVNTTGKLGRKATEGERNEDRKLEIKKEGMYVNILTHSSSAVRRRASRNCSCQWRVWAWRCCWMWAWAAPGVPSRTDRTRSMWGNSPDAPQPGARRDSPVRPTLPRRASPASRCLWQQFH